MKSFLFTTLATAASAAGSALAVRVVELFWRRVRHEPPPATSKMAAFLLGAPLGKQITRRLRAPA